jgi:hypothetical protein
MMLLSMPAPALPAKLRCDCKVEGLRTLSRKPRAVELGFILRVSETDLMEGIRLVVSLGLSGPSSSCGVLASEDSSEPGEPGVGGSSDLNSSSGMAEEGA